MRIATFIKFPESVNIAYSVVYTLFQPCITVYISNRHLCVRVTGESADTDILKVLSSPKIAML